jgi:hypothetical protein
MVADIAQDRVSWTGSMGRSTDEDELQKTRMRLSVLEDEQNTLVHLHVSAEAMRRVKSAAEAIGVAVEILHNLIGVHRYGVWLDAGGSEPNLVAPAEERFRTVECTELRDRAIASRKVARGSSLLPMAIPLMLGDIAVGAIVITELVPQVAKLGHMQSELLKFLTERLAHAMCDSYLRQRASGLPLAWAALLPDLPRLR